MDPRRAIPAVDRLLGDAAFADLLRAAPRERIVSALQAVQAKLRERMLAGEAAASVADPAWYADQVRRELAAWERSSLERVINATGVVLHTNLGRAPLAASAIAAIVDVAAGYSNLEYDLERGERGSRYGHCVELLRRVTGAEDALVVNNNAAALVLALNTLALGREAVISRGELVEIGGAFRVPEIMARSGAIMVEVGATNRTHPPDYRAAISERTGALVKVHRSNFRQTGFVAEVPLEQLAPLAREHGVPLLYDLGSGLLHPDLLPGAPDEPTAAMALAAGADLVAISGDKLLGGPQAGILLGRRDLIASCRENPLCRALRVDKLAIAALAATLALYADRERARAEVPALRMLNAGAAELRRRAGAVQTALARAGVASELVEGNSMVGGGALPGTALPTVLLRVQGPAGAAALERALRAARPPVIARIEADRVLLDLRTVLPEEEADLVRALSEAAGR